MTRIRGHRNETEGESVYNPVIHDTIKDCLFNECPHFMGVLVRNCDNSVVVVSCKCNDKGFGKPVRNCPKNKEAKQ